MKSRRSGFQPNHSVPGKTQERNAQRRNELSRRATAEQCHGTYLLLQNAQSQYNGGRHWIRIGLHSVRRPVECRNRTEPIVCSRQWNSLELGERYGSAMVLDMDRSFDPCSWADVLGPIAKSSGPHILCFDSDPTLHHSRGIYELGT